MIRSKALEKQAEAVSEAMNQTLRVREILISVGEFDLANDVLRAAGKLAESSVVMLGVADKLLVMTSGRVRNG